MAKLRHHDEVTLAANLETICCGSCAGVYALARNYVRDKRQTGGFWNCPYCKTSWGFAESENDRLREEKRKAEQSRDWARQRADREAERANRTERRLSATKGVVTRMKNRVGKGVCPCCNRHFKNLERHMAHKHPDYAEGE